MPWQSRQFCTTARPHLHPVGAGLRMTGRGTEQWNLPHCAWHRLGVTRMGEPQIGGSRRTRRRPPLHGLLDGTVMAIGASDGWGQSGRWIPRSGVAAGTVGEELPVLPVIEPILVRASHARPACRPAGTANTSSTSAPDSPRSRSRSGPECGRERHGVRAAPQEQRHARVEAGSGPSRTRGIGTAPVFGVVRPTRPRAAAGRSGSTRHRDRTRPPASSNRNSSGRSRVDP